MLDPLKPTSVPIEAAAHRILEQSESYPGLRPLNVKETVLRFIDAEIQLNDANALVEDLRRVSFPPFLSKQYGLDGVTQTIEFWNEGVRTTAISWEGMPAEWQPFADWYSRARTLFESHLPLSTAQNQLSNREPEPHRPIRSLRQR
jgi:hypothetical protein